MSVRTLFIDRRPRGRCRLLRTRARPVHFRDVRRPRPVGSSPGSLRVPFVCSFAGLLALWATVLFFPKRHPTVGFEAVRALTTLCPGRGDCICRRLS